MPKSRNRKITYETDAKSVMRIMIYYALVLTTVVFAFLILVVPSLPNQTIQTMTNTTGTYSIQQIPDSQHISEFIIRVLAFAGVALLILIALYPIKRKAKWRTRLH